MKWLKLEVVIFLALLSSQTHALFLVDIQKDIAVGEFTTLSADMTDHGFNPKTDRLLRVDLFIYFRELNDDSLTDMPGDETAEFMGFTKILFGQRFNWSADIDTGLYTEGTSFDPANENNCAWWDENFNCVYDPVKSGYLFIGLQTAPDTLWVDEVRWEVEVLRKDLDESSSLMLLAIGLFLLGAFRRQRK
ncbi:MAG: hypothetical protein B0W54_02570 [Cellvibrio sp. 79]|nr:MAG: hypothetical protein B0W54_02570 [Cellvibrio sp. 79]